MMGTTNARSMTAVEEENNLIQMEANADLYEELLKTQENQQAIMEGLADIYEGNMEGI